MVQLSFEQVKELVLAKYKQDAADEEGFEMYKPRITNAKSLVDIALWLEDDYLAEMFHILESVTEEYPEKESDLEFILKITEA